MKYVYFFISILFSTPLWAYSDGAGFYELSNYSTSPQGNSRASEEVAPAASNSEVTSSSATMETSPRPLERPQQEAKLNPASAPAPKQTTAQTEKATPTTPPANYSLTATGTKGNHGERLGKLKSCEPIKMILGKKSSRNNKCGDVTIAMSFAPVLMKNLPVCVAEAAKAKGIQRPIKQTNIYNADSYSRRTTASGRGSLHSTGRAFDIYQIDVQFNDGTWIRTPMTIASKNDKFYKSFNKCWERLTKASNRCGFDGLIDCNDNRAHHDHVHLSMPYCPKKAGYSSI